nr:hypothetical protein [Streptomyces sp. SID8377]
MPQSPEETAATATRKEPAPEPPACPVCKGTGEVAVPVRIGRKRAETDHRQAGICLTCFGSGEATESE